MYEKLVFPAAQYPFPDKVGLAFLAQILSYVAIIIFFWASFRSKLETRALFFLLFTAATLTEYGYRFTMGRFSVTEDYRTGLQTLDINWFKNAAITFLGGRWPIVIPLLAYGELLIWTSKKQQGGLRQLAGVLFTMVMIFSLVYPFSRGTFPTLSMGAFWRTLTFTGWRTAMVYRGARQKVPTISKVRPKNNIVFIVDESVRGDHLSVNGYARNTTPYLDTLKSQGHLRTWGVAAAASTTSLSSNATLLTGVNQLPDIAQDIYRLPTIFMYAKAMGYQTYYLDVQMNQLWLMTREDLEYLDEWLPADSFKECPPSEDDTCAGQYILERLLNSSGNFIWVNKHGAHFPYGARVPADFTAWRPIPKNIKYAAATSKELVNIYDSVIVYNLEAFFQTVITPQTLGNTTFVYTSDHGQTLNENGETWPHSGPTRNEAMVPILIIQKDILPVNSNYLASHFNLFSTLLDLMSVPETARVYPYALSLLKAQARDSNKRYYLVGDINNTQRSLLLPFDIEK